MPNVITTLLNGKFLYHCGPDCYDSTDNDCTCICDGLNHGVGLRNAQFNTLGSAYRVASDIMKRYPETEDILFHFHA